MPWRGRWGGEGSLAARGKSICVRYLPAAEFPVRGFFIATMNVAAELLERLR